MNSKFPLPGMQSGFQMIQFKNGINKKSDASINQMVLGTLDGKPASVVYVSWSTGGTGVWEVLGLYRMQKGELKCVGCHDLEDRAAVKSVKISNNQIVVDWIKHAASDSAPSPSLPTVTKLKSTDFKMP